MDNPVFAVLGGDARQGKLCSLLASEGYTVFAAGFDKKPEMAAGAVLTNSYTAAAMAKTIIFPVMPTKDGSVVFSEYADENIALDDKLCDSLRGAEIFSGFSERLKGISKRYGELTIKDYSQNEAFLLKNAQITAEVALMLVIEKLPKAIYESSCLITGYGRIGRALAPMVRALGAKVTVAARSAKDFAAIESSGYSRGKYSCLPASASRFDFVVNTADAPVIGEAFIRNMDGAAVIVDVASGSGGVDFDAALRCGVTAVHALGLPGRYAPVTAARIIKDTVLDMMEEEHN